MIKGKLWRLWQTRYTTHTWYSVRTPLKDRRQKNWCNPSHWPHLQWWQEKTKGSKQKLCEGQVIIPFTPRTTSTVKWKWIAMEFFMYANEIKYIVTPMGRQQYACGPINSSDMANPQMMHGSNRQYFSRPVRAVWQAGVPIYGVGVRFLTNCTVHEFINR
jgi:hypothetical protein